VSTTEVVIRGVRIVVRRGGVDDGEGGVEEVEEAPAADRGDEARIVGLDDVRGERGLDVRAEGEGEWHRADGLEGRGELVDLEQRDHVAFNQRGVVDIDGEDGRERVERVRAARTVEAEAEAEAEIERGGDVTGGLFDVVTV